MFLTKWATVQKQKLFLGQVWHTKKNFKHMEGSVWWSKENVVWKMPSSKHRKCKNPFSSIFSMWNTPLKKNKKTKSKQTGKRWKQVWAVQGAMAAVQNRQLHDWVNTKPTPIVKWFVDFPVSTSTLLICHILFWLLCGHMQWTTCTTFSHTDTIRILIS